MKVTMTKKGQGVRGAAPAKLKAGSLAPVAFNLQDNGDLTYTVFGVDSVGAQSDISAVATLAAASDNTAVLTADAPVGMTGAVHTPTAPAPTPGQTANLTLTATLNDGNVGPFTIVWPFTIIAGGVTGITVQPGTPTVH
jgi:hypothetical protein